MFLPRVLGVQGQAEPLSLGVVTATQWARAAPGPQGHALELGAFTDPLSHYSISIFMCQPNGSAGDAVVSEAEAVLPQGIHRRGSVQKQRATSHRKVIFILML